MSKYIIDIPNVIEWGVATCRTEDGFYTRDFDSLEELTADYINEHFSDLQDDAYNKGYAQCQDDYGDALKHAKDTAYQRGLNDAWECARKIAEMWETIDNDELLGIFGLTAKIGESTIGTLFKKQTAAEAIEKLKAYEEKQKADEKIEVGDEVNWLGTCFIVTRIFQPHNMKEQCDGIDDDGCVYNYVLMDDLEKTGRHFNIQSILEAMKHD